VKKKLGEKPEGLNIEELREKYRIVLTEHSGPKSPPKRWGTRCATGGTPIWMAAKFLAITQHQPVPAFIIAEILDVSVVTVHRIAADLRYYFNLHIFGHKVGLRWYPPGTHPPKQPRRKRRQKVKEAVKQAVKEQEIDALTLLGPSGIISDES